MDVLNFFLNFLLQMAFTLGLIMLFGKLIALCNGAFYRNFGPSARAVCYITGIIGTPVHEGAHALMCLIFGHRITEIKLFQVNSSDGTLGYVKHSYNPRNFWQRIGCLFIGIAPVIVGGLLLALLLYLLLPELFVSSAEKILAADFSGDLGGAMLAVLGSFANMFGYIITWQWWVFIIAGSFIALHMTLSSEDVKGALAGVFLYMLAFLAADGILLLVGGGALSVFTGGVLAFGMFMLFFFCIFLAVSLVLLAISFMVRAIRRN